MKIPGREHVAQQCSKYSQLELCYSLVKLKQWGRSENFFLFPFLFPPLRLGGEQTSRKVSSGELQPVFDSEAKLCDWINILWSLTITFLSFHPTWSIQLSSLIFSHSPLNTPICKLLWSADLVSKIPQHDKSYINLAKEEGQGQVVQVCFPRRISTYKKFITEKFKHVVRI